MNNLGGPSSSINPFIQHQGEVRQKQGTEESEAESKEKTPAFEVIKIALAKLPSNANLSPAQLNEKVSRTITDLSNDDPDVLSTLPNRNSFPILYKNIDLLVDQYKKIQDVNSNSKPSEKDGKLKLIAQELVDFGDYDKSLEVTKTISKDVLRSAALQSISKAFVTVSDFDRAAEIAKLIPKKEIRIRNLKKICNAYVITGNGKKAIMLSNKILDPLERSTILQGISSALKTMNEKEKAENVFKIAKQNIDLAIKNASELPDDDISKQEAFEEIIKALLDMGNVEKAIEITSMHTELNADNLNEEISRYLARCGGVTKAVIFANKIENIDTKERTLSYIVEANVNPENLQMHLEIVRSITMSKHRESALKNIIDTILEIGVSTGDIEAIAKARDIINSETDMTIKAGLQEIFDNYHPE